MRSALRPLCVVALLLCKLAQAAIVPLPVEVSSCPHHTMQQVLVIDSVGNQTQWHSSCCKHVGCACLQAAALLGATLPSVGFVGTAESTAALPAGSKPAPSASLFRPPILQLP